MTNFDKWKKDFSLGDLMNAVSTQDKLVICRLVCPLYRKPECDSKKLCRVNIREWGEKEATN